MLDLFEVLLNQNLDWKVYVEYMTAYRMGGFNKINREPFSQDFSNLLLQENYSKVDLNNLREKYSLRDLTQGNIDLLLHNIQLDSRIKS
mgnify:FL=1